MRAQEKFEFEKHSHARISIICILTNTCVVVTVDRLEVQEAKQRYSTRSPMGADEMIAIRRMKNDSADSECR